MDAKRLIYSTKMSKRMEKKALRELKYSNNCHYTRLAKWQNTKKIIKQGSNEDILISLGDRKEIF